MGARDEKAVPAIETEVVGGARRLTWVRPEVRRLAAGSAEEGAGAVADGGAFPS